MPVYAPVRRPALGRNDGVAHPDHGPIQALADRKKMARLAGLEPTASASAGLRSIQTELQAHRDSIAAITRVHRDPVIGENGAEGEI